MVLPQAGLGVTHTGTAPAQRDVLYEEAWLRRLEEEALRRYGTSAQRFIRSIRARLDIGKDRYGDDDFLSKDLMVELLEETPDVAAYCLLETQKENSLGRDDHQDKHYHLFEAALHAAAADYHARMAG